MLAKCRSVAVFGIEAYPVEVEVDVRGGLPDVSLKRPSLLPLPCLCDLCCKIDAQEYAEYLC